MWPFSSAALSKVLAGLALIQAQIGGLRGDIAALRADVGALSKKQEQAMTIQNDLVAAVKTQVDEGKAAMTALIALEGEVADLKSKQAAGVDPAVIAQAIADLGTSAKDLSAAIPATPAA